MQYSDSHLLLTRLQKKNNNKNKILFRINGLRVCVCVSVCLLSCVGGAAIIEGSFSVREGVSLAIVGREFCFLRAPFLGGFYLTTTKKKRKLFAVCLSVGLCVRSVSEPTISPRGHTHSRTSPSRLLPLKRKEKKKQLCVFDR